MLELITGCDLSMFNFGIKRSYYNNYNKTDQRVYLILVLNMSALVIVLLKEVIISRDESMKDMRQSAVECWVRELNRGYCVKPLYQTVPPLSIRELVLQALG